MAIAGECELSPNEGPVCATAVASRKTPPLSPESFSPPCAGFFIPYRPDQGPRVRSLGRIGRLGR